MSISTVTSEALQLKLRQLLPSQQGFSTDLSASDTIIPIIDLTGAAEGSDVPTMLQTALGIGATHDQVSGGTTTIVNNTGFYRVFGNITWRGSATNEEGQINVTDGVTTTTLYELNILGSGAADTAQQAEQFDFVVFLAAGESINAVSSDAVIVFNITTRQIADINGVLVNPTGFNPQ